MSDVTQGPETPPEPQVSPVGQAEEGFKTIGYALGRMTGEAGEHPMLQDARTHLTAAQNCILAALGS